MVTERLKKCAYHDIYGSFYFWRTYDGHEIDLVEEREGKLSGYEFAWSGTKKGKIPRDWLNTYKNAGHMVINKENYLEYIL